MCICAYVYDNAGTIGLIIARDTASCGHATIVLEKENVIGGVWAKNDYPGLRLQVSGASYRCFSLAPAWMRTGRGRDDVCYRPTGQDVLGYLHEMAAHDLLEVCTRSAHVYHQGHGGKFTVGTKTGVTFLVHALAFAPGAHETTAGACT
jgi:cation diffusion facilitator CzcD-associated flavoprotein CzcO